MAVLFVGQEYLKERSVIDDNVDFKKLVPIIEEVQDFEIEPMLGTNLYEEIQAQILVSPVEPYTGLTAANKALLVYIKKTMVPYIQAKAAVFLKIRLMNRGTVSFSDDNTVQTEDNNITYFVKYCENVGELYRQRMTNYIIAHLSDYPAYQTGNGLDKQIPRTNSFELDLYLPDTGGNVKIDKRSHIFMRGQCDENKDKRIF